MNHSLISADNTWALFAIIAAIATLALYLEQKTKTGSKITGCVMALIGSMILSNTGVIPLDAPAYDFVWSYIVPLAIPMLLFNADIKKIGRESGRLLIIYLISGIGTIAGGFAAYNLLKGSFADLGTVLPMMIGTYTGGSVNLVAMADAYKVGGELVSASVVADNLLMALYFFALIAAAGLKFLLGKYRHPLIDERNAQSDRGENAGAADFWSPKQVSLKNISMCIALSLVIVAISVNISGFFAELIPTANFGLSLINGLLGNQYLIITTLTMIAATLFPEQIGNISGAQEIGTYLIHIFFAVIGVPASIYMIAANAPLLLLFCAIIVFVNMLFSFGFGRIFGFSLEEIIISSNANIGGPTTAAAMAIAKGWNALIVPAILVGILGYVLGNYYGIFVGTLIGL